MAWPRYWWRRALHPLRGDAPVTWRYTRSERVQCLRIGCTAQRSNTPKKSLPPRRHHPQTGTHEATRLPSTAGVEGAGGTGGPGGCTRERRGLASRVGDDTTTSQISHVIYRGHFSRCPKNVAIPTIQMQCLNNSSRNYVRNYWLSAIAGHQGMRRAQSATKAPPV